MIGILRADRRRLPTDAGGIVARTHCASCVAVRNHQGWIATLGLPYEADLLVAIALGIRGDAGSEWAMCTAAPILPRRLVALPVDLAQATAAFAVAAAWACADDAARDDASRRGAWLRNRLTPRLAPALAALAIAPGSPPDPRLLATIPAADLACLPSFLAHHRAYVGGLWRAGLAGAVPAPSWRTRLDRLGDALGDAMVLLDAIEDRASDAAAGQPNPLATPATLATAEAALDAALATIRWTFIRLAEPWRSYALACVPFARPTAGVHEAHGPTRSTLEYPP
jgi:hypothetical protein